MKAYLSNLTEMYCKNGILRIEKILPNTLVINGENNYATVSANKSVEKIKFYTLSLKNGTKITLGENTLVETTDGIKKIQDVEKEDYVLHKFVMSVDSPGENSINWDHILGGNAVPIKVPKKMSPDLALWLGIVSSKGRYYEESGYVAISLNNKTLGSLIHELTIKLFKIKPKTYEDKRTGYIQHYVISRNLVRFLKSSLGVNSNLKKVPQQLLEGSIQEQLAFIQGLTLDGYIEQGSLVVYGGVSKRLSDFSAMVLRNCGHAVYQQIRKTGQGNDVYYTKILSSIEDCKNLFALESEKTEGILPVGYFVKVSKEVLATKISSSSPGYSAFRNLKQRGSKVCYNYTLDELNISYPKTDYYVQVKEIATEIQSGYCLEVSGDNFSYNGLILK